MSIRIRARFGAFLWAACALAALAILAAPAAASPEAGPRIQRIKIVGQKRLDAGAIEAQLTLKAGDAYDAAKADESFKAIYGTGQFKDVRLAMEGSTLVVTVTENPLVNRVAFEGNKNVKAEVLAGATKLKARGIFSSAIASADARRILEEYQREGYYAAQVDPKTIELDQGRVDVVFEIREGPQSKLAGINFAGNKSFSDAELRRVISSSESGLLDFFKSTVTYDPDRVKLDSELLRRHYHNNGFADMRLVSAVADVDREGKGFFLTFTVDEGPRYTFGALEITATATSLDLNRLREKIKGVSGEIYSADVVEKSVETLSVALAESGHPFTVVRPRLERDAKSRTISIFYTVQNEKPLYIERIDISGNRITKEEVIRHDFRVSEGDPYNRVLVEQGKQRLLRTRFFKDVKIATRTGSAPDKVILSIALDEEETGELSFAAGYSSNEGLIGDITYTERNLMGTGQYLQVKVAGSFVSGSAEVSWTEPRFLDRNLSFGVDAFVKNSDYTQATGYLVAGYQDLRVGGTTRLGFALTDEFTLKTNYTLMLDNVFNVDPNASLAVKQIQGAALISSVGYSLIYDTRNNTRKPTRGFYFAGTQDFAGVGGDISYLRSTSEMRAYYPITPDITLAGRLSGGNIMGLNGQDVRIVDAFFKGSETIRGFQSGGFGPRDAVTGNALGGTTYYAATTELRFPLPFVPPELGLGGAVFADAGSLFGTDANKFASAYASAHGIANTLTVQNSTTLRSSVGASLTWDSPVGPLRADFSSVLTKAPGDKTQVFGFGYAGW